MKTKIINAIEFQHVLILLLGANSPAEKKKDFILPIIYIYEKMLFN